MDRRVKERLIGASILVVLIVLIVPELLSGPAPAPDAPRPASSSEPVRNVTVDLATRQSPAPEPPAAPPDTPAASPPVSDGAAPAAPTSPGPASAAPTSTAPSSPAPPPAAPPAQPKPESPAPLEKPAQAPILQRPTAAAGSWAVQLGSFANRANADKLVHQLKGQGFAVYVLSGGSGASARYRVRIGPMGDRGAAAETIAKLKSRGYVASLVPPAT